MQIGGGGAVAPAVADRHLHAREAILDRAVVVIVERVAGASRRFEIGVDQRVLVARLAGHPPRSARPRRGGARRRPARFRPA